MEVAFQEESYYRISNMIWFHKKDPEWYWLIHQRLKSKDPRVLHHLTHDKLRVIETVTFLQRFRLEGKKVCEIGIGGVGVACSEALNAQVTGYDYLMGELFKSSRTLCDLFSIPFHNVDLNQKGFVLQGNYDAILLCEVLEHLVRMPLEVIIELKNFLNPGGLIFITTPNLVRLSNRIKLLRGKQLFAPYRPRTYHGHMREYTPEEVTSILSEAGFGNIEWNLRALPDDRSRLRYPYQWLCACFPRFSNSIFCWGDNPLEKLH
jgi:2-polyprenyl-3-methyl-5-hydroxy-6-metoxy-1,4-benzoquinol methylase